MKTSRLLLSFFILFIFFIFFILSTFVQVPLKAAENIKGSEFHEVDRLNLGGDGGWDYMTVDLSTRKLFIARSDRVQVVDTKSGKLEKEIPDVQGAHGIALIPHLGIGFATAGRAGETVVFGMKTFKPLTKIKVGENPDSILYDSSSEKIFVFNGKSKTVSIIDPQTKTVLETLKLDGKPEFAASDEAGKIFVNIEDKNKMTVIDSHHLKVAANFQLAPCEEPTGLSIDSQTHRLFVGCGNKMAIVVDGITGKILKKFTVGAGVDATAFDPIQKLAFVSAGEGRLSIIKETGNGFDLVQDLVTQKGARTLAVDSDSGKIYLATTLFKASESVSGSAPESVKKPVSESAKEPIKVSTKEAPNHTRPSIVPGSFFILVIGH